MVSVDGAYVVFGKVAEWLTELPGAIQDSASQLAPQG